MTQWPATMATRSSIDIAAPSGHGKLGAQQDPDLSLHRRRPSGGAFFAGLRQ